MGVDKGETVHYASKPSLQSIQHRICFFHRYVTVENLHFRASVRIERGTFRYYFPIVRIFRGNLDSRHLSSALVKNLYRNI